MAPGIPAWRRFHSPDRRALISHADDGKAGNAGDFAHQRAIDQAEHQTEPALLRGGGLHGGCGICADFRVFGRPDGRRKIGREFVDGGVEGEKPARFQPAAAAHADAVSIDGIRQELVEDHPVFGARPLRRVIQNEIEDRLSEALLEERFHAGDTVRVNMRVVEDAGGGKESLSPNMLPGKDQRIRRRIR
jgi:hypothetical protein